MADDEDSWLYGDGEDKREEAPTKPAEDKLSASATAFVSQVSTTSSIDTTEAKPEPTRKPSVTAVIVEPTVPGEEEDGPYEEDSDDSDEDDVQVTIGDIKSGVPASYQYGQGVNIRSSYKAAAAAKAVKGVDLEAEGTINGTPVYSFEVDALDEKPWRKPGADITDYFNYGFNEDTWSTYREKQRRIRSDPAYVSKLNKSDNYSSGPQRPKEVHNISSIKSHSFSKPPEREPSSIQTVGTIRTISSRRRRDTSSEFHEEDFSPPDDHGPPPPPMQMPPPVYSGPPHSMPPTSGPPPMRPGPPPMSGPPRQGPPPPIMHGPPPGMGAPPPMGFPPPTDNRPPPGMPPPMPGPPMGMGPPPRHMSGPPPGYQDPYYRDPSYAPPPRFSGPPPPHPGPPPNGWNGPPPQSGPPPPIHSGPPPPTHGGPPPHTFPPYNKPPVVHGYSEESDISSGSDIDESGRMGRDGEHRHREHDRVRDRDRTDRDRGDRRRSDRSHDRDKDRERRHREREREERHRSGRSNTRRHDEERERSSKRRREEVKEA